MTDQNPQRDPNAEVAVPEPPELLAVPADTSYEIELDERPQVPAAPVYADISPPEGTKLPVIPKHLQSLEGIKAAGKRHAGRQAHRAAYHGIRTPKYLFLALCWAVVGVFRLTGRQIAWWWHLEAHGLRSQAGAAGDSREYMKLHRESKEVRRVRGGILGAEVLGLALAAFLLVKYAPWYAWGAVAALALPALARAGRPADKPIVTPAEVTPRFRVLNSDIVLRAYYSAGLGNPDKPGQQIQFGGRMARDGDGTHVLVDLPYGKGLKDAIDKKDDIASGLDVTESQVFIRRDPTSYRRHTLWVADRDPLAVPVGRTPLLACRQTDIWRPAPVGLDERGQLVEVLLMWVSVLIGALPRQGKTFVARLLALFCALNPFVKMDVFDAKGSPDWRKFALVADSCAFGLTPTREGLPPEIFLNTLEALKRDVQDRYNRLSELPPDVCPEGKLTREIARDPRFRMPVRVLVLDEFQEWFDLGEISKDIAALLVFLLKVAPGAGVSVIGATQKPSGIGTGQVAQQFTSFRDNFAVRFGLRTSSWQVSEMVLGQGAYSEGLDTSTLLPQYKGVGILRGATDVSPTVRTYLADGQDAEKILTAARAIRERAGTLSGRALGEGEVPQRDVLADVLTVIVGTGIQWPVLAERLAKRFPDRWADASADALSAQLRSLGVPSVDVKVAGRVLKGCRRADVEAAAGSR
jgi:DNA segregation ATPase FtsK/SpoIIIE, S-DNA-T family